MSVMNNQSDVLVVDVREPWEFDFGHAEGSVNIPLSSVPYEIEQLRAVSKPIVLVCASGNRSGQATAWLQAQGFNNVSNGGAWQNALQYAR